MDDRSEGRDGSGSILVETCRIAEDELVALIANPAQAHRREEMTTTLVELRRLSSIVASWRLDSSPDETTATTVDAIMALLQRVDSWSALSRTG